MNIQTLREKYPQYDDLSDKQLADAIHNKFYSDMPINQFYAKIGFQQYQPPSNINSQPKQSSVYTQPQQSNNYAQPKITTNKPAITQPQIAANTTIKNNTEQNTNNMSLYVGDILIGIIILFFVKKQINNTSHIKYNDFKNSPESNSTSYTIVFLFSLCSTVCNLYLFFKFNPEFHFSPVAFLISGYLSWLIYNKENVKILNLLKGILWFSIIPLFITSAIAIFAENFIFVFTLIVAFSMLINYLLLCFFQKRIIIEENETGFNGYSGQNNNNNNSRYNNNNNDSQYDYGYKKQKEYTSSSNQYNYKKQDDDTSNNNNNYQYEKKQNEQSYHSKSSNSNQHSTFDDRLDELKSNIAKCYEILEVPQNATPSEIKAAFKKKMSSYHPDKVSGLGEKLKKVAEEESKLINVAYQTLKSKGKC